MANKKEKTILVRPKGTSVRYNGQTYTPKDKFEIDRKTYEENQALFELADPEAVDDLGDDTGNQGGDDDGGAGDNQADR